jgi:hypothetical protein
MRKNIIILLLLALVFSCCKKNYPVNVPPPLHKMLYTVSGTVSSVNISYDGYDTIHTNIQLPWSKKLNLESEDWFLLQVTANSSGYLSCYVYIDDTIRAGEERYILRHDYITLNGQVP